MNDFGVMLLVALIGAPLLLAAAFLLLMITGVFHEPVGAKAAALGFKRSWAGLRM